MHYMKNFEIHIQSYFSIETDLASAFSNWSEFVSGEGYNVLLRSEGEEVFTQYVLERDDEIEDRYLIIKSNKGGALFQRALGFATYLLSQHSDNLIIHYNGTNGT